MTTALAESRSRAYAAVPTPDVTKKQFGLRLRELRVAAGLSQLALAELIGVSQGRLSQWEDGDAEPLFTTGEKIAAALGVTVNDLLILATTKPPPPKRGRPRKPDSDDE